MLDHDVLIRLFEVMSLNKNKQLSEKSQISHRIKFDVKNLNMASAPPSGQHLLVALLLAEIKTFTKSHAIIYLGHYLTTKIRYWGSQHLISWWSLVYHGKLNFILSIKNSVAQIGSVFARFRVCCKLLSYSSLHYISVVLLSSVHTT